MTSAGRIEVTGELINRARVHENWSSPYVIYRAASSCIKTLQLLPHSCWIRAAHAIFASATGLLVGTNRTRVNFTRARNAASR